MARGSTSTIERKSRRKPKRKRNKKGSAVASTWWPCSRCGGFIEPGERMYENRGRRERHHVACHGGAPLD